MAACRLLSAFTALATLLSTLQAAPLPKPRKPSSAGLYGTWAVVESGSGENELKPGDGSSWQFNEDGTAAIIRTNGQIDGDIKFTFDPKQDPKQFDWLPKWGTYCGCYVLEGDTLTLYLRSGTSENRVLEARPAGGVEIYKFQRK